MGVGRLVLGTVKYLASPESRMAYRAHLTDGRTSKKKALQTLSLPKAERDMVIFANTEQMGMGRFHILHDAPEPLIDSHLNDPWSSISDADQGPIAPQHLIDPGLRPLFDVARSRRWGGSLPADQAPQLVDNAGGGLDQFTPVFNVARLRRWGYGQLPESIFAVPQQERGGFRLTPRTIGNQVSDARKGADMVIGPNTAEPVRTTFKTTPKEFGNQGSETQKWLNVGSQFLYYATAPHRLLIRIADGIERLVRRLS